MNLLFDIGHPAHFYLFHNFIKYLKHNNHNIFITTREKDITNSLLNYFELPYNSLSKQKGGYLNNFIELVVRDWNLMKLNSKFKFDAAFSSMPSISHISLISKMKSYGFGEDDDQIVFLDRLLSASFLTKMFNPDCMKFKFWKRNRILYNSYHELAYLHPNNFISDNSILGKYSLKKNEYIVLRLSALKAYHDTSAMGISDDIYSKIKRILNGLTIIESKENNKTHQIEPWDMHHVLAHAKMIICDSQTMAAEAMVLGVPSIRINTFVGKISYLEELENKYQLGYGILPIEVNKIFETIKYLIEDPNIENLWMERKQKMLSEKCDFNQWMIDYFEKEINN